MDTKELTQYMKYVKMLESRAYELTRIYNKLSAQINYYNQKDYSDNYAEKEKSNIDFEDIMGAFGLALGGAFIGAIIGLCIGTHKESGFILLRILKCEMKYIINGFLIGGFFVFGIWSILFIINTISMDSYNRKVSKYNVQVTKNIQLLKAQDMRKIHICKQEQDTIRNQYKETVDLLHRAYQLNVLHPKYQNFVAVCSLYEYLETGRCTELTGHEGGYNIFEMEKRLNLLVLKMDEIINKLDQIQANQHTLYQEMTTSNKNAARICNQVSVISEQLGNIEQNQSLIEYNTSIASSNTEFLKWLAYFEA